MKVLGAILALIIATHSSAAFDEVLQPAELIEVPSRYQHALVAELRTGNLHIYRRLSDGSVMLIDTMPISIGKQGYGKQIEGDAKTPIGVYRITSYLTDEQLDDFYGNAAYPVNYPNVWDKRLGRTGSGIWLHAEPYEQKTRPLRDSDGCIVLSNNDIDKLAEYLDVGYTHVISTPEMQLLTRSAVAQRRSQLKDTLSAWIASWEQLDHDAYMSFYADDFHSDDMNFEQWEAYKQRVNSLKTYIDVEFSELGLYAYPGEDNMVLAEFYQSYDSSNYRSKGWKRLLLRLDNDQWKIIYEGGG
ncbi:L,D-transpeptidase family protein [Salinibius halmophilus]|uniref:L,D-transpeptidase family protein n=1 Tax=Salinibius halmophilus TaxID=1853216 RepID=UPI000E66ED7F|nr:L,D-transpeptidase family protein [Salinibius halmophilus]